MKSIRIPDAMLRAIRDRARMEDVDESTAIRQLIALGMREYAVRLYREGRVTLQEAARVANLTVREMLEVLWEHGVRGNVTMDQQEKAASNAVERMRRR